MAIDLRKLAFKPDVYGWRAVLPPAAPKLFEKLAIILDVNTRLYPQKPEALPEISETQEALLDRLSPALPIVVKRVELALTKFHKKHEPNFLAKIDKPRIWLAKHNDDGITWAFITGRKDNKDFGYHAEFKGEKFVELWAGD